MEFSDKAQLRQFLQDHFSLEELKTLAFDLGVNYELIPHRTRGEFSRELVAYFERKDDLSCLLQKVLATRHSDELVKLLIKLSACSPRKKIQIILRGVSREIPPELLAQLATATGATADEIELICALQGSLHLLISLPEEAADVLTQSHPDLAGVAYKFESLEPYETLDETSHTAWLVLAVYFPFPNKWILQSGIRWDEVTSLIRETTGFLLESGLEVPRRALFYYYAGCLALIEQQWGVAITQLTKALEIAPNLNLAYVKRGVAQSHLKRFNDAIADFDFSIRLNPTFSQAYSERGVTYARKGAISKALSDFRKAVELNPGSGITYTNMGWALLKRERNDEALNSFSQAIELSPKDTRAYLGRGITNLNLRRPEEAVRDLSQAIALDAYDARAYLKRGVAYEQLARYEEARADFVQAIRLDPDNPQAHSRLDDLLDRRFGGRQAASSPHEYEQSQMEGRGVEYFEAASVAGVEVTATSEPVVAGVEVTATSEPVEAHTTGHVRDQLMSAEES